MYCKYNPSTRNRTCLNLNRKICLEIYKPGSCRDIYFEIKEETYNKIMEWLINVL